MPPNGAPYPATAAPPHDFNTAAMRRWLTVALLVLLPLQSFWAAAATYCAHEQSAASQHFGHHEHRHHGASAKADGAQADAGKVQSGAPPALSVAEL